jgi:pSer/pThr/pTyr-binding forkhead associated (FHA) protein
MAFLIGMSEEVRGERYELGEDELTFGRAPENTVVLTAASVSSHHCRLVFDGREYLLDDLGSTNGTRVNGRRITKVPLRNKNLLQVGTVEFLFEDESGESAADESAYETSVEVDTAAAEAPQSFTNISPFNTRKKESKGLWYGLLAVMLVLTLASVGYFLWVLLSVA